MDYLIYIKTLLMQGFTSLHKQAQVSNHMKMDPAVPLVYGTIVPDSYNVPSSAPIAVEAAPTSRMDLRTATAMNGGRSSRVLLPYSDDAKPLLNDDTFVVLQDQGFTRGLAEALMKNKMAFPLSFWIVDNSGSMNKQDGHRFVETNRERQLKLVSCTRWSEMQQTVEYHAQLAALLKNPTVFRLLNDPGRCQGPQQFSICEHGETIASQNDLQTALSTIRSIAPYGVTPLTDHINEIYSNVLELLPELQRNGTKVVIVIATDGTPTDNLGYSTQSDKNSFIRALKLLEGLPVWVVVRLCTDDDEVVEFWNGLDSQLELNMEVLDDFSAEAKEVYEHNKWLNYGLPIHRMREMGFYHKLFDLLDERKLMKDELRDFFRIMFGDAKMAGIPDPQVNWNGFCDHIGNILQSESKQWNPLTKRMEPWVNLRRLRREYATRWFSFC